MDTAPHFLNNCKKCGVLIFWPGPIDFCARCQQWRIAKKMEAVKEVTAGRVKRVFIIDDIKNKDAE